MMGQLTPDTDLLQICLHYQRHYHNLRHELKGAASESQRCQETTLIQLEKQAFLIQQQQYQIEVLKEQFKQSQRALKTTSSGSGMIVSSENTNNHHHNFSAQLSFKSITAHKLSCDQPCLSRPVLQKNRSMRVPKLDLRAVTSTQQQPACF